MDPKIESLDGNNRLQTIIAPLCTIEDLKGLTDDAFNWLASHGTERFGDDGDLIVSQGTPPRDLMFVLAGDVIVHRHSSSPVSILIAQNDVSRQITARSC